MSGLTPSQGQWMMDHSGSVDMSRASATEIYELEVAGGDHRMATDRAGRADP